MSRAAGTRRALLAPLIFLAIFHGSPALAQPHDLRFTGAVRYLEPDREGDGLIEVLTAEVELEVSTAGEYAILGTLWKDDAIVANRPSFESALFSRATLSAEPGVHTVSLSFSGEEIYRSGVDGPYVLALTAVGASDEASFTVSTPAYDHTRFGEAGGSILAVRDAAVDEDGDGLYDVLELTIDVEARRPGDYFFQGGLSKRGESITYAGRSFSLGRGTHTLKLSFPGLPILRAGVDGPYAGTLSVIDTSGHRFDGTSFVTRPYSSAEFEPLLELDGRFDEAATDTNDNGLFDLLRIRVGAAAREPGGYQIDGVLKRAGDPNVVFADTVASLSTEPALVTLDFAGPSIRAGEFSGPYTLEVVLRDPDTQDELDRLSVAGTTAAYEFIDFEPFDWAPIMLTGRSRDRGIDLDGDERFDELQIQLEVELAEADQYEWRARLVGPEGTEVAIASGRGELSPGLATIQLSFDGRTILASGIDGPYSLKSLLIFGRKGAWVTLPEAATTREYASGQFGPG